MGELLDRFRRAMELVAAGEGDTGDDEPVECDTPVAEPPDPTLLEPSCPDDAEGNDGLGRRVPVAPPRGSGASKRPTSAARRGKKAAPVVPLPPGGAPAGKGKTDTAAVVVVVGDGGSGGPGAGAEAAIRAPAAVTRVVRSRRGNALAIVMSRLAPADLLRCAAVCRRWHAIFCSASHWRRRLAAMMLASSGGETSGVVGTVTLPGHAHGQTTAPGTAMTTTTATTSAAAGAAARLGSGSGTSAAGTARGTNLPPGCRDAGSGWPSFVRGMRDARNRYVHARLRTDALDRTNGHPSGVTSIVASGGIAVTCAAVDYNVLVWDTTSNPWRIIRKLRGEAVPIALALSPSSGGGTVSSSPQQLITASDDGGVRLWSLRNGQCKTTLYAHRATVTSCAWSPSGRWVSGSIDCTVQVYDADGATVAGKCEGHESAVRCVAALGESFVVSGGDDATVRVWDVSDARSPRPVSVLRGHTDAIITVAGCEGGSAGTLASGSHDRTIRVWSVRSSTQAGVSSATCLHIIRAGSAPLCLMVSPYLVWAGLHSGTVAMYTRDTYECAHSIPLFAKKACALTLIGGDLVTATSTDKQHIKRTTFVPNPRSAIVGLGKALEAAKRFAALAGGAAGRRSGRMKKSPSASSLAQVPQRSRSGSGGDADSTGAGDTPSSGGMRRSKTNASLLSVAEHAQQALKRSLRKVRSRSNSREGNGDGAGGAVMPKRTSSAASAASATSSSSSLTSGYAGDEAQSAAAALAEEEEKRVERERLTAERLEKARHAQQGKERAVRMLRALGSITGAAALHPRTGEAPPVQYKYKYRDEIGSDDEGDNGGATEPPLAAAESPVKAVATGRPSSASSRGRSRPEGGGSDGKVDAAAGDSAAPVTMATIRSSKSSPSLAGLVVAAAPQKTDHFTQRRGTVGPSPDDNVAAAEEVQPPARRPRRVTIAPLPGEGRHTIGGEVDAAAAAAVGGKHVVPVPPAGPKPMGKRPPGPPRPFLTRRSTSDERLNELMHPKDEAADGPGERESDPKGQRPRGATVLAPRPVVKAGLSKSKSYSALPRGRAGPGNGTKARGYVQLELPGHIREKIARGARRSSEASSDASGDGFDPHAEHLPSIPPRARVSHAGLTRGSSTSTLLGRSFLTAAVDRPSKNESTISSLHIDVHSATTAGAQLREDEPQSPTVRSLNLHSTTQGEGLNAPRPPRHPRMPPRP